MNGGQLSVSCTSCRAVEDANAVSHHMLDVLNTHLMNTRGPLPRGGAQAAAGAFGGGAFSSSSAASAHAAILAQNAYDGHGAAGAGGAGGAGSDQLYIMELFRQHAAETDEGCSVREIAALAARDPARKHLGVDAIMRVTEALMMEGFIYSTVDDLHFKPTS